MTAGDRIVRGVFRTAAFAEASTWLGLIVSMILKYPLAGSPLGVTVFGWLHGLIWIVFVTSVIAAAIWFRWAWWAPIVGVVISVVPFMTVPFDLWMERSGRLRSRSPHDRRTAHGDLPAERVTMGSDGSDRR